MIKDLKKFEAEIDKFQSVKEIHKYERYSIIKMLLTHYDYIHIPKIKKLVQKPNISEKKYNDLLKTAHSGLTHCIKWSKLCTGKLKAVPKNEKAWDLSLQFLLSGCIYNLLCEKISLSYKDQFKYSIDFENKIASFEPTNINWLAYNHYKKESQAKIRTVFKNTQEFKTLLNFCEEIYNKTKGNNLFYLVDWLNFKSTKEFETLYSFFSTVIFPKLPDNLDLGGYSLKEFRVFYSIFYLISLYDIIATDASFLNLKDFKANIPGGLSQPRLQFINSFVVVTGLDFRKVNLIVNDLTINLKKFASKILVKPFISFNGQISWLPRSVFRGYPGIILPNILYKDKKEIYDNLINAIENTRLQEIKEVLNELLKNDKIEQIVNPKFKLKNKIITPDIVLIDKKSESLFVIEYKYAISAYTPYDVSSQFQSITKHFDQLRNYLDVLQEIYPSYKVFGIVMFHYPVATPILLDDDPRMAICDFRIFINLFSFKTKNFEDIVKSLRNLFDMSNFKIIENSYSYGEWKINTKIAIPFSYERSYIEL